MGFSNFPTTTELAGTHSFDRGGRCPPPRPRTRASDLAEAVDLGAGPGARFLCGGTNLVDVKRETIEDPDRFVDVGGLSAQIERSPQSGVMIGAATRITALAEHMLIGTRYPMLTCAIVRRFSANPQHGNSRGQCAVTDAGHLFLRQ